MAYPNITTNFSTLTDYKDRYRASHINALQTAVNSIIAAMPHKQQVVVVAKARGDYDNFASAIVAITDSSASKPYAILLMPGVYETSEATLPDYVSLVGVDYRSCILKATADVSNDTAFVVAAGQQSLIQNITVINNCKNNVSFAPTCITVNNKTAYIDNVYLELTSTYIAGASSADAFYVYSNSNVSFCNSTILVNAVVGASGHARGINLLANGGEIYASNNKITVTGTIPYGESIVCGSNTTLHVIGNTLKSTRYVVLYTGTALFEDCHLEATDNNMPAGSVYSNNGKFYGCTVLKHGTATECFDSTAPQNIRVAHCRMNLASPLHANLTNLIATPYNVTDTDV